MPPAWFEEQIAAPRTDHYVTVREHRIHYQSWSDRSTGPGLLFVHGNGAHAHWWDFIAPSFATKHQVVAIDLGGAGDSDHRPQYSAAIFADEILNVIGDAGLVAPTLIGHSFGGSMARICSFLHPGKVARLILVDSPVSGHRVSRPAPSSPREHIRYFASLPAGKKRFRLRPPQPCENDYILDYIAGHSLSQTEAGYRFKLDQAMFANMVDDPADLPDTATMVNGLTCPVGLIYGADSRFFPESSLAPARDLLGKDHIARIDNAHHHVFLDQPREFISVLGKLLEKVPAIQTA